MADSCWHDSAPRFTLGSLHAGIQVQASGFVQVLYLALLTTGFLLSLGGGWPWSDGQYWKGLLHLPRYRTDRAAGSSTVQCKMLSLTSFVLTSLLSTLDCSSQQKAELLAAVSPSQGLSMRTWT